MLFLPAVLWTADPTALADVKIAARIGMPDLLVTGASAEQASAWLERHPWAKVLPLASWHPEDGPAWARMAADVRAGVASEVESREFQAPEPGNGFWTVAGPAEGVRAVRSYHGAPCSRIDAVIFSARDFCRGLGKPRAWEICADATGGLLALGASIAQGRPFGRAIACGVGNCGPLLPIACDRHAVRFRAVLAAELQAREAEA